MMEKEPYIKREIEKMAHEYKMALEEFYERKSIERGEFKASMLLIDFDRMIKNQASNIKRRTISTYLLIITIVITMLSFIMLLLHFEQNQSDYLEGIAIIFSTCFILMYSCVIIFCYITKYAKIKEKRYNKQLLIYNIRKLENIIFSINNLNYMSQEHVIQYIIKNKLINENDEFRLLKAFEVRNDIVHNNLSVKSEEIILSNKILKSILYSL